MALDQKILFWLNSQIKTWGFWNKLGAEYLIYLVPITLLWLWFYDLKAKKVALRAVTAIILAWPVLALTIGHFINRDRPFDLGGIRELVFHRPTYSFPSDHAAALFALTASLWFSGYKKLSLLFLVISIVVSIFRVGTGLHWPSDILGGAVLGIIAAWLVDLLDKPLNIVYEFIIKIARKLRLA